MNLLRFSNFISREEAREMSSWVLSNKENNFFTNANMGGVRLTTRFSSHDSFEYPSIVLSIRKRILNLLDLHEEESFNIKPPFKNGIVASCAFPGDTCYEHVDPIWHQGFNTLHCNVVTQSPDNGGQLILNGVVEPMQELELCCYLVSKVPHSTTLIGGAKERIMWVFGFCVDDNKWKVLSEQH